MTAEQTAETVAARQRRVEPVSGRAVPDPIPSPPRLRRRWGLFAAAVAAICLGALGNVWLHQATSDAHQVVAARSTISRGQLITRGDLQTVQVGVDPALLVIPASQVDDLVGKRAALDMAAGSLVTPADVTDQVLPAHGRSVVGVAVPATLLPDIPLMAGDQIRVVATPGAQGDATTGVPATISASVVSETSTADTGQGSQTVVTVEVPDTDAAQLAAWAATGNVAIVLDSRQR